jgi:hypothetical protein
VCLRAQKEDQFHEVLFCSGLDEEIVESHYIRLLLQPGQQPPDTVGKSGIYYRVVGCKDISGLLSGTGDELAANAVLFLP